MNKAFLTIATLFIAHAAYASSWEYSQKKDEMRGTISYSASLQSDDDNSDPSSSGGLSPLEIVIFSDDDKIAKRAGIILNAGQISCFRNKICEINAKFDDGKIELVDTKLVGDSNDAVAIFDAPSFVEKMRLSKRVYIEVPLYREGKLQYKFTPDPIRWNGVKENQSFMSSIGNFNLLEKQDVVGDVSLNKENKTCYLVKDFKIHKEIEVFGSANVCLFGGMIYSVNIEYPYGEKTFSKILAVINKELGTKNDKNYPMWLSDGTDGLASIMVIPSKKDKKLFFSYSYNPVSSLVPEEKN